MKQNVKPRRLHDVCGHCRDYILPIPFKFNPERALLVSAFRLTDRTDIDLLIYTCLRITWNKFVSASTIAPIAIGKH